MPEPIVSQELTAVNFNRLPNGNVVFDFGANIVGVTAFAGNAPVGATITLTHGEVLNSDGSVNNSYAGENNIQVDT